MLSVGLSLLIYDKFISVQWKDKSVRGTHTLTTIGIKGIEFREEKDRGFHLKILLVTYKILNGQSAGYLEPLIKDDLHALHFRICKVLQSYFFFKFLQT